MAAKRRTNVALDAGVLAQERLREVVAERRRQQWLAENREALADASGFLSRHGLWSDGRRQF